MTCKKENKEKNCHPTHFFELEDLGQIPYKEAWKYQHQLVMERLDNFSLPDKLLLVEHPPVYTLGTGSSLDYLKFDLKTFSGEIYRTERGGEVTYHCLGQIVCYPIFNLRNYRQDLHWYLRQLEEVIIHLLGKYDILGERIEGLTGVWVEGEKIAAIGIKVKKWITMHGVALNVTCDLSGFEQIIPCGISHKGVTKISNKLPTIEMVNVKKELVNSFKEIFSST